MVPPTPIFLVVCAVRALVGLCKLGASGGHDASLRPFADGSATKLAEACRRFLINPGKDNDLRYMLLLNEGALTSVFEDKKSV